MSLADLAAVGLPAALVIRLASAVAALALARHARAGRTIALGGSIGTAGLIAGFLMLAAVFGAESFGALAGVTVSLPALPSGTDAAQGPLGVIAWSSWAAGGTGTSDVTRTGAFDHLVPAVLGAARLGGLAVAGVLARAGAVRRVPSWGCGGELTPQTEYTASYLHEPLARGVWRVAAVMKGLQAGNLHAYRADVLVLGVLHLRWLGGSL